MSMGRLRSVILGTGSELPSKVVTNHDLEKVVDRTNFQPALIGRLNARFELKHHLISDGINPPYFWRQR